MIKVNPYGIKLIIGLGNPGKEYEKTYHNVGFLAIDFLAKNPLSARLLKSNSYMNQSGSFVAKASKKYGIKPEEILIIHDDSDIELGKYKVSFARGSAGHRGVQSIIDALATKNFWRLRIGIRPPKKNISVNQRTHQRQSAISRRKASEIVLKKISKKDLETLEKVFQTIFNYIRINQLYQH
jgi:PTH1 family peptidyl-tRNA hydrolase